MGGRSTTQMNYGEGTIDHTNLEGDKPDGLRRLTSDVVQRQHTTDEAVTFLPLLVLRHLTNDGVQRQHTTDEAVTPLRPIQKNRPTSQSMPLTTDGDRLVPARRVHQKKVMP